MGPQKYSVVGAMEDVKAKVIMNSSASEDNIQFDSKARQGGGMATSVWRYFGRLCLGDFNRSLVIEWRSKDQVCGSLCNIQEPVLLRVNLRSPGYWQPSLKSQLR